MFQILNNICRQILEWIIDHFLLQWCQNKRCEQDYYIFWQFVSHQLFFSEQWPFEKLGYFRVMYRVDKKYASDLVSYEIKNFLETPFMNSNFDSF